jgi:hypothetical protein
MAATGIERSGLPALEAAFKAFAVRLPEAGEEELKDTVRKNTTRSAQAVMSRPGSSGKYHREPDAYSDTVKAGAPAIEIARGGTAIAAEFGANFHTVFGKRVPVKSMKRRVFGARVKRNLSGKVVGRVVKADLPAAERRLAVAFDRAAEREFTKRGL